MNLASLQKQLLRKCMNFSSANNRAFFCRLVEEKVHANDEESLLKLNEQMDRLTVLDSLYSPLMK